MVDGVAGEVKFANFDALQNTLKINGQTGYPVNNTLYVVTLEDGVVKSGHIVTDGEQLKGYANYPLSSAYNTYSDITINIVEGAAGTVDKNYSDRDTFADSLYHDYSANKYYSVVTDLTKVVGTMAILPTSTTTLFLSRTTVSSTLWHCRLTPTTRSRVASMFPTPLLLSALPSTLTRTLRCL